MVCGCMVCGVVCSTSSGFSSGFLFSVGVFGLGFPLFVCARGLAHLVFLQERKNILPTVKEFREGKPIWRVSFFVR